MFKNKSINKKNKLSITIKIKTKNETSNKLIVLIIVF